MRIVNDSKRAARAEQHRGDEEVDGSQYLREKTSPRDPAGNDGEKEGGTTQKAGRHILKPGSSPNDYGHAKRTLLHVSETWVKLSSCCEDDLKGGLRPGRDSPRANAEYFRRSLKYLHMWRALFRGTCVCV